MSEQACALGPLRHQEAAAALHRSVMALLGVLALGPTGRDKQRLGRGCVCWGRGHAGIPRNADAVSAKVADLPTYRLALLTYFTIQST